MVKRQTPSTNGSGLGENPPSERDYEVGYGRPPKHTRFKPGQSGNPRGRPKGAKSLRSIAQKVLMKHVAVLVEGQRKQMPLLEALLTVQSSIALKGNQRAAAMLLDLQRQLESAGEGAESDTVPEIDLELMLDGAARLAKRRRRTSGDDTASGSGV